MGKTAILAIRIIGDATDAVRSVESLDKSASSSVVSLDKASVAAGLVLAGTVAVAAKLEEAGEAASTSNARILNVTESMGLMGDKADDVTDRLVKSAEAMARNTGIDPNLIKQGQATLSTFENIAKSADEVGGVFDRATAASADLSATGFGSVESASVMLGKALNDPTKGITALTRVGVTFTDAQRDQIAAMQAAGDMAGAQEQILAAVERQVGGTAEATANASDKMAVSWQLAQEQLGQKLLPAFEAFRELGLGAAGWLGENTDLVIALGAGIGILSAGILVVNGAMKVYAAVQAIQTAAQWANNAAWLASPVTWIVLAVIAAIAILITIIVLVITYWDELAAVAAAVWSAIVAWIEDAIGWLRDGIIGAIQTAMKFFTDLGNNVATAFRTVVNWIRDAYNWLMKLVGNAVPGWVKDLLGMGGSTFTARMVTEEPTSPTMAKMLYSGDETATAFSYNTSATTLAAPTVATASLGALAIAPTGTTIINNYDIRVEGAIDKHGTARTIREVLTADGQSTGELAAAGQTWR